MRAPKTGTSQQVSIPADSTELTAHLRIPPYAEAVVVFVEGADSTQHGPRSRRVAERLYDAGYGALLFDSVIPEEDRPYDARFNVEQIGARLLAATRWVGEHGPTRAMRVGYFGASVGAAAALTAVAALSEQGGACDIHAVVSRGGRVDLAGDHLAQVTVPTLLIVGERDADVLRLNEAARVELGGDASLEIVPRAGHLFEEAGAIDRVADLAIAWFSKYL
jgi:dienelactone hydrolase